MKAAVITSIGEFRVETVDDPGRGHRAEALDIFRGGEELKTQVVPSPAVNE
jgi:hypothetical protein